MVNSWQHDFSVVMAAIMAAVAGIMVALSVEN